MINPTTVRIVIENLRNNGFTTAQEKLLGVVLAHVPEIQQCEIIEILELSKPHSRNTLQEFVEKKLVDTFGKRAIFYRPTGLRKPPLERPTGTLERPTGTLEHPTGTLEHPTGTLECPPDFPKTHNVKLTELTELNLRLE